MRVEGTEGSGTLHGPIRERSGLGDREQEEGEFYGKIGPKHSAPHQIQDSVLDRSEEEV